MKLKFLFNPFRKIAGPQALWVGWAIMLLSGFIAFLVHSRYNGVLDFHFLAKSAEISALSILDTFISWLLLALVLILFGAIGSKSKFRWIDVLGTTALAKCPLILEPIIGVLFGVNQIEFSQEVLLELANSGSSDTIMSEIPVLLGSGLLMLLCIVWYIVLLYNAYVVSTNVKKPASVVTFIFALIIAEVIGMYVFTQI